MCKRMRVAAWSPAGEEQVTRTDLMFAVSAALLLLTGFAPAAEESVKFDRAHTFGA